MYLLAAMDKIVRVMALHIFEKINYFFNMPINKVWQL